MLHNPDLMLCLWLACAAGAQGVFTPVLKLAQGRMRGLRSVSGQNRYYGIPYAVSERFQAPQDPPKWDGVFTAGRRFGHCAQRVAFLTLGSEACQELDVFAPEGARPSDELPVLVFLHGGGYYYGSKAHYDPEFLVMKNVIVVIVNYRVGVLGFLCAHGVANLGLKDQAAALRWVRRNIAAFGGDPDNVTISGQSAGASAAAMHMLSEASKGLFHKAILMSGTPMTPWAFNVEPLRPALEDAAKLARVSSEEDVYNIFMNASLHDLLAACGDVSTNTRYFKYSPCMDTNTTEPFFRGTPHDIITSGRFNKVPILAGFTDVEGMLFYGLHDDQSLKEWDENFVDRLPSVFSWCPERERKRIAEKLRFHYFGDERIDRSAVKGVVDYYSDWMAYASADAFSALVARHSPQPVFNYMFSYEGWRNFAKLVFGRRAGLAGASHSDDIFYVFKPAGLPLPLSAADGLFVDRFTTLLTNFMKYGDPTPEKTRLLPVRWPAAGNTSRIMRLGRELTATRTPHAHRGGFMRAILCAHGLTGDPTPEKTRLLPVRWPAAGNTSRIMRLGRELTATRTPHAHRGGFMRAILCAHGLTGYVPCDR